MLRSSELTAAIVTKLKLVSALVSALGSSTKISAYTDSFASYASLMDAVSAMPAGTVLVTWDSTTQDGRGQWEHGIDVYIRPSTTASGEVIVDYILDGTATGDPLRVYDMPLHASCLPMRFRSLSRFPLAVTADAVIEFHKLSFSLVEIGG